MRLARAQQTSFTAGEIGPELFARIEVARYYSGAALLRNVLVRPQGSIRRRPGMAHIHHWMDGAGQSGIRLVPFAFNTEQTYLIVLTEGQMQAFRSDGLLLATVGGCPWNGSQAAAMNWCQSADTLLLFHPDIPPQRIRRGGVETTWTRDAIPLTNLPTHDYGAVTPTGTMTLTDVVGFITITASASVFTPDMVGWQLWGHGGKATITAHVSATEVSAHVTEPFEDLDPFSDWTLREPIISATRGWPECGTFHQSRLWLAGLRSRPATFMASKTADFFNFSQGTALDDEAIVATIDSDQVNAIHQIVSGRSLQIFTSGAEHVITGEPITPKSIGREEQTRRGIKRFVPTVEVEGATLFVQRQGAALRQFIFVDAEQAWRTDLTSLLAPHLIQDPIALAARKTARQDDADQVLLVNGDGQMRVLTTLRAQEVQAFSRWETTGIIRAVAALLSGEVFFAVERAGTLRLEAWHEGRLLDASARRADPAGFQVMSGLSHLEGQEIDVLADGAYLGRFTVSGYSVTLPRTAYVVEAGLPVDIEVQTLPVEPRDASGSLIGRKSRIQRITARVRNSGTFTINGQPLVLRGVGRAPNLPLDTPPPIRTGDMILRGLLGWKYRHEIVIAQPSPQPFEMLGMTYEMRLAD